MGKASVLVSNVLNEEKKQQAIALRRLGWSLRQIQKAIGVRRETISIYLRAAGIAMRSPRGQYIPVITAGRFWVFAEDNDDFRRVVDDVQHAPVTDPDAPLVLVAFQLFTSCDPGVVGQRQNFPVYPGEQRIVERIQFLLRRRL